MRNFTGKARGKRNQSALVFIQNFRIHSRLIIKSVNKACRNDSYKIFIALLVSAEQNKVIRFVLTPAAAVIKPVLRSVNLAADNRLNALALACLKKVNRAVHNAVVSQSKRRLPELLCSFRKLLYPAHSVKQAVFTVHMQMSKHTVTAPPPIL